MSCDHRKAFARVVDRRRKHLIHRQLAEAFVQREPAVDRAGHRDRQRAERWNRRARRRASSSGRRGCGPSASGRSRCSRRASCVFGSQTMAKRSPPMPQPTGSIRPSAAFAAMAASTALPPFFRMSIAICVASGCAVAAMPCRASTGARVAKPGSAVTVAAAGRGRRRRIVGKRRAHHHQSRDRCGTAHGSSSEERPKERKAEPAAAQPTVLTTRSGRANR